MSDQLSKVDECLRSLPDLWERTADACSEPAAAHAIRCCANELQLRIATIDPAAGPVEVEEVADDLDALEQLESDIDGMADCTERVRSHIATLARQLAYSEEANANLKTMCAAAEARAEQAESALAAATRRVAEVEGLVRKWRKDAHDYRFSDRGTDLLIAKMSDELEAALQKEPK